MSDTEVKTTPVVLNKKRVRQMSNPPNGDAGLYVGRGSAFGNPFPILDYTDPKERDRVCDLFESWIHKQPALLQRVRAELKGRNLVCFCAPARCHADTLLRIANATEEQSS